jgi:hypothetical protein
MQQTQDRTDEVTERAGISGQLRSLASGREWLSTPDDLRVAWAHEVQAAHPAPG